MGRPANPDLTIDWKIPLPATLAGAVEHELMSAATGKPRYGERSKLIAYLLNEWLKQRGRHINAAAILEPSDDLLPTGAP
jgi:hypothetical protein